MQELQRNHRGCCKATISLAGIYHSFTVLNLLPKCFLCSCKCKAITPVQTATSVSLLVMNKLHAGLARTPREDCPCQTPHAVWSSAFV